VLGQQMTLTEKRAVYRVGGDLAGDVLQIVRPR
jgi:hypothetical protein